MKRIYKVLIIVIVLVIGLFSYRKTAVGRVGYCEGAGTLQLRRDKCEFNKCVRNTEKMWYTCVEKTCRTEKGTIWDTWSCSGNCARTYEDIKNLSCWVNTCGHRFYPECNRRDHNETCTNCPEDCGPCDPVCTPSCTPACGQADGCGATCGSGDAGVPGVPVLDPEDGDEVAVGVGEEVRVEWPSDGKADYYKIELYPEGGSCADVGVAYCNDNTTETSYSFAPLADRYYYQATAVNNTCGVDEESQASATFSIMGIISGQVREDNDGSASLGGGEICTLAGAPGVQPGAGSEVIVAGSYTGSVDGSGNYSVEAPAGLGLSAVLVPDASNYRCTCPDNCEYGTQSPKSGLDFFVSNFKTAWFQSEGGNIHADVGNVTSSLPDTCEAEPSCKPYLITEDASGTTGAVSYGGGLGLGDFDMDNISENDDDWRLNTSYEGLQTGYDYFARILEEDPDGIETWGGGEPGSTGVFLGEGINRISGSPWSIPKDRIVVLLVPNDIVIDVNIDVDEGGFLAIISSGNIVIGDSVTNVEGVYIADEMIQTCESLECGNSAGAGDVSAEQLVLEGIFTGWNGVAMKRDFNSPDNNIFPAELFIYRPDLQTNAYRYLLWPHYTWKEQKV